MEAVLIYKSTDDFEVEQIRQLLLNVGIQCQVVSDVPRSVFPLSLDGLGELKILTLPENVLAAKKIISEFLDNENQQMISGNDEN